MSDCVVSEQTKGRSEYDAQESPSQHPNCGKEEWVFENDYLIGGVF